MNPTQDFARWITGNLAPSNPNEGYPIVVAETRLDANPLVAQTLANGPAVAFVRPEFLGETPKNSSIALAAYTGTVTEPGGVVELGDGTRFLIEAYRSAPFLAPSSPACVTVFDEADFRALIEDADAAFEDASFEAALLNPAVLIADAAPLAGDSSHARARLFVDAAGELRAGPRGAAAHDLADVAAWGDRDMFTQAIGAGLLERTRATRPWLGRYLQVLGVAALIPGAHSGIEVSGFGWSPLEAATGPVVDTHLPIVAKTAAGPVVWSPKTNRAYEVSTDVAAIVDHIARSASGLEVPSLSAVLDASPEACDAAVASLRHQFFLPESQPSPLAA